MVWWRNINRSTSLPIHRLEWQGGRRFRSAFAAPDHLRLPEVEDRSRLKRALPSEMRGLSALITCSPLRSQLQVKIPEADARFDV